MNSYRNHTLYSNNDSDYLYSKESGSNVIVLKQCKRESITGSPIINPIPASQKNIREIKPYKLVQAQRSIGATETFDTTPSDALILSAEKCFSNKRKDKDIRIKLLKEPFNILQDLIETERNEEEYSNIEEEKENATEKYCNSDSSPLTAQKLKEVADSFAKINSEKKKKKMKKKIKSKESNKKLNEKNDKNEENFSQICQTEPNIQVTKYKLIESQKETQGKCNCNCIIF